MKPSGGISKPTVAQDQSNIFQGPDAAGSSEAPVARNLFTGELDAFGCWSPQPLQNPAQWNPLYPAYLDEYSISTPDYNEPIYNYKSANELEKKEDAFRMLFIKLLQDTDIVCLYGVYQEKVSRSTDLVAKGQKNAAIDEEIEEVAFKVLNIFSDIEALAKQWNGGTLGEQEYWVMIEEMESLGIGLGTDTFLKKIEELRRKEARSTPPNNEEDNKVSELSREYKTLVQRGIDTWGEYTELTQDFALQIEIVADLEEQNSEDIYAFEHGIPATEEDAGHLYEYAKSTGQQLQLAKNRLTLLEHKLQKLEETLVEIEGHERVLSSAIMEALVWKHDIRGAVAAIKKEELNLREAEAILGCYKPGGQYVEGCDFFLQNDVTQEDAKLTIAEQKEILRSRKAELPKRIEEAKQELLAIRRSAVVSDETYDPDALSIILSSTDHAQLADALILAGAKKEAATEYNAAARIANTKAEEQLYIVLALQLEPARLKENMEKIIGLRDGIGLLRMEAQVWNPASQNCLGILDLDMPMCGKAPGTPEQIEVLNGIILGALYDALSYQHDPGKDKEREEELVALETELKKTIAIRTGKTTTLEAAVLMEDVDRVLYRYTAPNGRLAQIRMSGTEKEARAKHQDVWMLVSASEGMTTPLRTDSPDDPFTNRVIAQKWHLFVDAEINGFQQPLTAIQQADTRIFKPHSDSRIVRTMMREFKLKNQNFVIAGAPNTDIDERNTHEGSLAGKYTLSSELLRNENTGTAGAASIGVGLGVGIIASILTEGLYIPFLIGGLGGAGTYAGTDYLLASNSIQYEQSIRTGFSLNSAMDYDDNLGSFGISTFFAGLESAMWWTPVGAVGGFGTRAIVTKGTPKAVGALKGAIQTSKALGVRGTATGVGSSLWRGSTAAAGALVKGAKALPTMGSTYMAPAARWVGTRAQTWWQQFSVKKAAGDAWHWSGKQFGKGHRWKTTRVLTGAGLTGADLFAIDDITLDENYAPEIIWGTDGRIDTVVGTVGALMLVSEGAQTIFNMPTGGTYVTAGFRAGTEQIMLKQQGLPLTTLDPNRLIFGVIESRTVEFFIASFIRGEEFLKEFKLGRALLAGGRKISANVPGFQWMTTSLIQRGNRSVVGWVPKKEKAREIRSVTLVEEQAGGGIVVKPLEGEIIQTLDKAADGSGRLTVRVRKTGADGKETIVDVKARRYKSGDGMPEETRIFLAQRGINISPDTGRLFALNSSSGLWENGLGIKLKHKLNSVTIPAEKLAKKQDTLPEVWRQRIQKDGSLTVTNADAGSLPPSIRNMLESSGVLANGKDGLYTTGNGSVITPKPLRTLKAAGKSMQTAKAPDMPGVKIFNGLKLNFYHGETIPDEVTVLKPAYRTTSTLLSGKKVTSMDEVDPSMRPQVTSELAKRGVYVDDKGRFFSLKDAPGRNLSGQVTLPGQKTPLVYYDPAKGTYSTLDGIGPMGLWGKKSAIPAGGAPSLALEKVPLRSASIGVNPSAAIPVCTGRDGKYQFTARGSGMMFGYVAPIVGAFNFWLFAPAQGGDPSYQLGQRLTNYGITIFVTWPYIQWPLGFWTPEAEAVGRAVGIPVNILANRVYPNKRNQFPGWETFYDDVAMEDFDSVVKGTNLGITNFGGFLTQTTSLNVMPSFNGDHGEYVMDDFEGPALETWRRKMDVVIEEAGKEARAGSMNPESMPQSRWIKKFALTFENYYQQEANGDLNTLTRRMLRIWAAYIKSTVIRFDPKGDDPVLQPFRNLITKYPAIFSKTPILKSEGDWNEFIGKVNTGKDPALNFHLDPGTTILDTSLDDVGSMYIEVPGGRLYLKDENIEFVPRKRGITGSEAAPEPF